MSNPMQTAMIIDDDPDLGELLTLMLAKRKIHAMAVNALSEAEAFLAYLKPNLVFLDNSFPEGLGINFISTIRAAGEDIIIIMMTADTASWIEEKAFEEGIRFFLRKPVTQQDIDGVLDRLHLVNIPH